VHHPRSPLMERHWRYDSGECSLVFNLSYDTINGGSLLARCWSVLSIRHSAPCVSVELKNSRGRLQPHVGRLTVSPSDHGATASAKMPGLPDPLRRNQFVPHSGVANFNSGSDPPDRCDQRTSPSDGLWPEVIGDVFHDFGVDRDVLHKDVNAHVCPPN
jgi:hypothetical protein